MLQASEDNKAVVLRWAHEGPGTQIEFASPRFRYRNPSDPSLAFDDMVEFTVRLSGKGLTAEALVLSLDSRGSGLIAFLEQLSHHFRGWEGTRTWENQDRDLGVEATWASRGHVALRWWVTSDSDDKWSASVEAEVEAGAEMSSVARALSSFFAL